MAITFTSSTSCNTYTVQAGDDLSTIAKKCSGDDSEVVRRKIHEVNKAIIGPDATQIANGMRLLIPYVDDLRSDYFSDVVGRVLELVNQRRSEHGAAPLTLNQQLLDAAQGHSQDMADHNFMSHTGSDGSSPWDRMHRAGYQFSEAGENVAAGYATPDAVMDGWMASTGHARNILNPNFREIGIGYAVNQSSQYTHYWTQDFGSR